MIRKKCSKKTFEGCGQFFKESSYLSRNPCGIMRAMTGRSIDPAFRERLMMAVTQVNGCSYCSWVHTRTGLRSGLDNDELKGLCDGIVDDCPSDQAVATVYAQHWADSDGDPDPVAVKRLEDTYGPDMSETIHLVLRMIRWGNFVGNSFENFLCRISLGKLGN